MKKYWLIGKSEIQRWLAYRSNALTYVVAYIFEIFAQIVIWTAIFKTADTVIGYNYKEMISYVIISWIFMFLSSNYGFEEKIAKDIHRGNLSNFLTKPVGYLYYMTASCIGRIAFPVLVITSLLIFFASIFFKNMVFQSNLLILVILFVMLILSFFIKLLISFIVGIIAFWTAEIFGIYELFDISIKILAGAFFPLAFLPIALNKINMFLPFAYTLYIPVQLYLGKISLCEGLIGLGVQCLWLVILFLLIKVLWKKGLKKYESAGA